MGVGELEQALQGKNVLVTGAAGSIGQALCRRLARIETIRLGLLDHFDHGLVCLGEDLARMAPQSSTELLVCSVRDAGAMQRCFKSFNPDVVIHAAALKHVDLSELYPGECVLTNLVGVRNALNCAHAARAEQFMLISSDKAAAPSCVMGAAKRLAELYLPSFAAEHGASMRLSAVRFGNVLGSQGSVAPRFAAQIAHGGPLTLTHPDMERYFLTMTEAVDFIARVISLKDETKRICTYVMDMGKPVSILDMAHEMIARAGREIEVKIIGSRPGEKLSEQLFDAFERVDPSVLKGVFAITPAAGCEVTSSDIDTLEAVAMLEDHAAVRVEVFARLDASLGRLNAASMANEAVAPRQYVM